jgi:protein STE50
LTGNRIERCLSYDEKPLLLFQKLKDAKKNPVFMLKHIKDIRSPIAVAQQKHAARKASSIISVTDTAATHATSGHHKAPSTSRTNHRPPHLQVSDFSSVATPLPSTMLSPPSGWPEPGVLSPAIDASRDDPVSATTPSMLSVHGSHLSGTTITGSEGHKQSSDHPPSASLSAREMVPSPNGISYAVAIYPYMAEQDDEFDVIV